MEFSSVPPTVAFANHYLSNYNLAIFLVDLIFSILQWRTRRLLTIPVRGQSKEKVAHIGR